MEKLILIDAYALIYRSYYAFIRSPRINSKGLNTSAILGFMNTLYDVSSKEHPAYLAVAFDHGKTFRHDMFPEYKAQREAQPEDITRSVPILKDILAALHIPCIQVGGFEADDIIGTLAKKADQTGITTYMLTPDKDFAQLVGGNVYVYRPRHGGGYELLDERAVCEKYEIERATQMIDLLALMGDAADNFPGCPGVGPKTAVSLIHQFGSVEELLSRTSELKGKLRENVENNIEAIRLAKILSTIRTDVPVELDLEHLKVKPADTQELRRIFNELEFRSLTNKFIMEEKKALPTSAPDLFSLAEGASTSSPQTPKTMEGDLFATHDVEQTNTAISPMDCEKVDTTERAKELVENLLKEADVSLSLVGTQKSAIDARVESMSLYAGDGKVYKITLPAEREKADELIDVFRPLFESETIVKVGHNLKYAVEVLRNHKMTLAYPMFDTMVAHYLIQPELRQEVLHRADIIYERYKELKPKLEELELAELFYHVEMPLVEVLADMEYNGVVLDTNALKEISIGFTERMNEIEKEIFSLAGHSFNISSPRQVGDVLFGEMKIVSKPKKTKTGQFVTNEEELQKLAAKHEIVRKILDFRGLKKLVSTYLDALPQLVNPRTRHIHTSFNQTVTATGRLSSSDPNLQNIPIRGEDGREIRKCFLPEPGCLFFSADYSQIELRVMAHLSGDETMIEAFRQGKDIHASTAAKVYKKNIDSVTTDERTKAKRANFGIIYGITTWGLAERLLIDRQEAKALIEGYFETFPKVKEYMEEAKETARQKGYAETLFHRRRYLPDISSANATVRGFAERNAINAPIQGTAADIIKIAMVRIFKRMKVDGMKSKMLLQVHDELNFSVIPSERQRVEEIVLSEMQNACHLRVPLVADSGWGENWLEAH